MRLPENLVEKWKGVVADLREKGEVPSLHHIGAFVRKRVRAEFGDIQDEMRSQRSESSGGSRGGGQTKGGRGVHSTQRSRPLKCHICKGSHAPP